MKVVSNKKHLHELINSFRDKNKAPIGFVPTMGYLHSGHGNLVQISVEENALTVVSIFINPLQFNNKEDYINYPKDFDKDLAYLSSLNCDIVYIPDYDDVYPEGHIVKDYNFDRLELVMEGKYRAGHFKGVAEVVSILLENVKPDNAYFGEKDYQQLKIIEKLVEQYNIPVKIIPCKTVREADGLAMSSRNVRLSYEERKLAPLIYEQLLWCKENYHNFEPQGLKLHVQNIFKQHSEFELEYLEFASLDDLSIVNKWSDFENVGVFIAVYLGKVRLIDNMFLFSNFAK